jgi:putative peptidoglycan lipid II flippase
VVIGLSILVSGATTTGASVAMGLACYFTVTSVQGLLGVASKLSQLAAVGGSIVVGVLVYFLIAYLLRMEEVQLALDIVGRYLKPSSR